MVAGLLEVDYHAGTKPLETSRWVRDRGNKVRKRTMGAERATIASLLVLVKPQDPRPGA